MKNDHILAHCQAHRHFVETCGSQSWTIPERRAVVLHTDDASSVLRDRDMVPWRGALSAWMVDEWERNLTTIWSK